MYLMYGKYSLYFMNPYIGDMYYVDAQTVRISPLLGEGRGKGLYRDEASTDYANTSWKHAEPISPVLQPTITVVSRKRAHSWKIAHSLISQSQTQHQPQRRPLSVSRVGEYTHWIKSGDDTTTGQDVFLPIPGLISYHEVIRKWNCYLMYKTSSWVVGLFYKAPSQM